MASENAKIIFGAEDRISPALASITRGLGGMQAEAARAASSLAAIGVSLSGAAMVSFVKGTIDAADGFNDLAQSIGIGIKELAGWQLAANQSGTSIESVGKGVKGLSQYMVEHGEKLRAAGITATDANGAMVQLADLFRGMPDGVEKTALAVQIFGKAGMDMIPMLNLGSAGLAEAQEKAAEYGKRMAELAPQADKFNDKLAEMQFQLKVVGIEMASHVAGPMAQWLEANSEALRIAGSFTEMLRLFVLNLDAMTTERPAEEIRRLTRAMKEYQEAGSLGKFMQSPTGFIFGGREADLGKQIEFLKFLERQEAMAGAAKFGDYRDARDLSLTTGPTVKRARALLDKSSPASAAKAAKIIPMLPGENSPWEAMPLNALREDQKAAATEEKRLAALRSRYVELADPLQKYRDQLDEIQKLQDMGMLTADQSLEAQFKVQNAMTEAFRGTTSEIEKQNDAARELGLTFSSAFEDAIIGGKGAQQVIQSLAQDVARIFVRKTVTEKLGNAVTDMFSGFDLGSFFGGARAAGGPVDAGRTYLVGEQGPELFIPGSNGTIAPNAALTGGGGQAVRIEVVNPPGRPAEVAGATSRFDPEGMVVSVVLRDIAQGGQVARSLQRTYGLNRAAGAF